MSTDLVTETPAARNEHLNGSRADQFQALREAQLRNPGGFLKLGVVPASTTCFENTAELIKFKEAEAKQNADPAGRALEIAFGAYAAEYGRYGNPTINRAEELVGIVTGREGAVLFPTKENAVTSLLSAVLLRKPGPHHIIVGPNLSPSTEEFLKHQLANVEIDRLSATDYARVGELIRPETRLVLLENEKSSIESLARLDGLLRTCREHKVLSVVEGFAAVPRGPGAPDLAADVLIPRSETISNKPEVTAGIVASNILVVGLLKTERGLLGGIPAPEIGAAIAKGLETFPDRAATGRFVTADLRSAENQIHNEAAIERCEAELAKLDRADDAAFFPSGMSATTTLFSALLFRTPGPHHIVVSAQGYRKNREFYTNHLKNAGVEITALEPEEFANLKEHLKPNTRCVFIESPTNPFFRVTDVEAAAAVCRANGVISVVDHTFATPLNQRPIELGADLVCVSATKYIGGHNDAIGGVIAGRSDLMETIRQEQHKVGAYPAAVTAERILDGMTTLDLRINDHNTTGLRVAQAIERDPLVKKVWYPGLESHPDHEIARRTLHGYGGVISFDLDLSLEDTRRFIDALELAKIAPSFGGTEPLVSPVADISHYSQTPEERAALGITPGLVRFSTGTFPAEPLIRDIRQAFDKVRPRVSEGVRLELPDGRRPVPSGRVISPAESAVPV